MRTKITLFLLLLVATLALFIVYIEPEWDADLRFEENRLLVLGAEATDIDFIRITSANGPDGLELVKVGGAWELTEPVHWPANPFAVNRILSQLQFLERETSFSVGDIRSSGQTLADFGLEPPEIVLAFRTSGEIRELKIGRVTDIGNRLYLLAPDGERIHVVNRSLLDSLSIGFENLRSNSVFSTPVFEIQSWNLQIRSAGNLRVRLTRREDDWIFETPILARADRAAVESTLSQIVDLKIKSFVGGEGADLNLLGLVNPDLRLTVEGGGSRQAVLIGNPVVGADAGAHEFYAKKENNDTVFTVEIPFLDTLRTAQISLRERRLFSLEADRLQSIAISRGEDEAVTLQKLENGVWQVVSRGANQSLLTMPGDQDTINRLVEDLLWVQALPELGFVSDAPSAADLERFGLSVPLWTIEVRARPEKPGGPNPATTPNTESITETLLIGGFEGTETDYVYAKMDGAPSVYLIRSDILRYLRTKPVSYRDRTLQDLPEGARITRLVISRFGTADVVFAAELTSPEASWASSLATLPDEIRDSAESLVGNLRDLRARVFLDDEFTPYVTLGGRQRPWTYLLEATIVLAGAPASQTTPFRLYLAEVTGGSTLVAGTPDPGLLFETEQGFADAFGSLVFDRFDPGEPPEVRIPEPNPPTPEDPAPSEEEEPMEIPEADEPGDPAPATTGNP